MKTIKHGVSYNPSEDCDFEVRLIAISKAPGTGESEEGTIWRFGLTAKEAISLRLLYKAESLKSQERG